MLYNCQIIESKEVTNKHEKEYGVHGEMPPNAVKITQEEFAQQIVTWGVEKVEWRQIHMNSEKNIPFSNSRLFYMSNGINLMVCYSDYQSSNCYVPEFYKFALCHHEWQEISSKEATMSGISHFGNCYHVYKCVRCGKFESVDSSG